MLKNIKKNKINKKYYKYLPSKKFTLLTLVVVVLGTGIFVLSNYVSNKSQYGKIGNKPSLEAGKLTLNDMLQKDSDGDGVADWEEALWGTDPQKTETFGISDATYIKQKKEGLKITNGGSNNDSNLTETDKFAQEFFASILAMKQNGGVDPNTMKNVSASLGQKIVDPTIVNKYTENDAKIDQNNSMLDKFKYYTSVKTLFNKYKTEGIGSELSLASGIASSETDSNNNTDNNQKLTDVGNAYQNFAQKMLDIPVPQSLISYHIKIVNNANNTGISVLNMTKISNDPVVGLSGLSQYKKYSGDLITSVNELETTLSKE